MIFNINRQIFKALSKELQKTYVYEVVCSENDDELDYEEEANIANTIVSIINTNETFHTEYGVIQKNGIKQVDETCKIPGFSEPSGFLQNGHLLVSPLDWSWDDNGDFDYSFSVYRAL